MGYLRLRRRLRVLPGVTLNVGKHGLSTSIGVRGAHVTVGHGHLRRTVGIPGTGLSYTSVSRAVPLHITSMPVDAPAHRERIGFAGWIVFVVALVAALALLSLAAPVVASAGVVLASLVAFNPSGLGDRIHSWRVWSVLPGLHHRVTALGFASVLVAYLVALPLTVFALVQSFADSVAAPMAQAAQPSEGPPSDYRGVAEPSPSSTPEPTPTPTPSLIPTQAPLTSLATALPTISPTPFVLYAPTTPPRPVAGCGAPANPWGYNFCSGSLITSPPPTFCNYFGCIPSFWRYTSGYVDQCSDGTYSHSGGRSGACSDHGGEMRALYG